METPSVEYPRRHRYTVLLAVLVTSVVIQTARTGVAPLDLAMDIVANVLGIAIFVVIFRRTREQSAMAVALVALIAIGSLRDLAGAEHARTTTVVFQFLLVAYVSCAIASVLRDLYSGRAPGLQNIVGAICGYLLGGVAISSANVLAYVLTPGAYNIAPAVQHLVHDWHGRTALFTFYSFTQMLTIGYSDVTPLRAPATTLSLFASIFGVFYTAVVVSQLVAVAQAERKT